MRREILVVGGGLGGVAAALAAASRGRGVLLTEPTKWLGGQLTSQAVPPDEHPWIERFGCTASYRRLRDGIREHYRLHYPLTPEARARAQLNPGGGRVSSLCHEPRAAVAVIESMLAGVEILHGFEPVAAAVDGDRVEAVTLRGPDREQRLVEADWVIDATETGELLPLAGAELVTGAESREQTGEPHAPAEADPLNMQAVSVCFALDHLDGEDHTIERPPGYAGGFSLTSPDPRTLRPVAWSLRPNPDGDPAEIGPTLDEAPGEHDLWLFRRIAARRNFTDSYPSDITLVNWPQIDYVGGPLFGVPDAGAHAAAARATSREFLHWLQTEAGFPGLRLRADVTGDAPDGLALAPYIRESRRIRAERTVVEQDIALDVRGPHGAVRYPDSVGIGSYRVDLHPSTGGDPYIDVGICPFQIPLGALIPVRLENLLPGAKNIGTTHITNGAYRLHPVEWNVGEVAGHLAAFCAEHGLVPRAVRASRLEDLQRELAAAGVELAWPDEVRGY